MQYKDQRKSLRQIARELHVDAILEGSVIRSPQRVRISIQLIDPQQDRHLWVETYERPLSDLVSLEGQVATDIAIGIKSALTSQERARIGKSSSTNIEAQEHYLRGRFFWNKRTEAGYVTAIEYFRKAIASSPSDPRPYAGLADAYALLGSLDNSEIPRKEAMLNAREAALAALHLDDSLAEAHSSLAFVKMHYEWDWVTAEREFQRAIDLNPSYATAHHWYAYDLMAMGRPSEALREVHRARELDPLSLIINTDVAELLYYTGQIEEALREARGVLAMDPDFALAHRVLGFVYLQKREYAKAISEFRRQQELTNSSAWAGSELAVTYAAAGDLPAAEAILNTILSISNRRFGTAGEIAGIYAALGRKDEAFKCLEQAYLERNGGLILLNWDPTLASLKTDPRFAALVRRIGLPP
jgi:tetratricopeptide (TPR) repeat protein